MDGLQATRAIRDLEQERARLSGRQESTPIIALSASASPEDAHAFLAAGMSDFLSKPVTMAKLIAMLAKWANSRRAVEPA